MASSPEVKIKITADAKQAEAGMDAAGQAADRLAGNLSDLDRTADRTGQSTGSLSSLFGSLRGAFTALAGAALAKELVDVNAEFDRLRASLVTITGSQEGAEEVFKGIQDFAAKTPYSVQEVTEAFIKLQNLGLTPSEDALRSYGNTAGAMGKTLMQFVEAVGDATTGEFERLKEFGIKASSSGNDVAFTFQGVTTVVKKNADEINRYLLSIGNAQFASGMDRQAATLGGALSNLGDAWDTLLDKIINKADGGALSAGIRSLGDALTWVGDVAVPTARAGFANLLGDLAEGYSQSAAKVGELFGITKTEAIGALGAVQTAVKTVFLEYFSFTDRVKQGAVGLAMVAENTWTGLATAVDVAFERVTGTAQVALQSVQRQATSIMETIASAARATGLDSVANAFQGVADSMRPANDAYAEMQRRIKDITKAAEDEQNRRAKAAQETIADIQAEIDARNAATVATGQQARGLNDIAKGLARNKDAAGELAEAYKTLGTTAEEVSGKITSQGQEIVEAFVRVSGSIDNTDGKIQAFQAALDKAKDPAAVRALAASFKAQMDGMGASSQRMRDLVDANLEMAGAKARDLVFANQRNVQALLGQLDAAANQASAVVNGSIGGVYGKIGEIDRAIKAGNFATAKRDLDLMAQGIMALEKNGTSVDYLKQQFRDLADTIVRAGGDLQQNKPKIGIEIDPASALSATDAATRLMSERAKAAPVVFTAVLDTSAAEAQINALAAKAAGIKAGVAPAGAIDPSQGPDGVIDLSTLAMQYGGR